VGKGVPHEEEDRVDPWVPFFNECCSPLVVSGFSHLRRSTGSP
jgi:hypothetical protein